MFLKIPAFCPVLIFCIPVQTDSECILNNQYLGYLTGYVIPSCIFQTILVWVIWVKCTGRKNSETEFNVTLTPTALEF